MRIAIFSDVHGNLTALEAVLAEIDAHSPDLVLHGGDLAFSGSRPAECVDLIRGLGIEGVFGNADEMLTRPPSMDEFAQAVPGYAHVLPAIRQLAEATAQRLGTERLDWLASQPLTCLADRLALVHAGPEDCWRSPAHEAEDEELLAQYACLGRDLVVYGHVHVPFIRRVGGFTVANSGSVGMPFDGDHRASWLLVQDGSAEIRRVEYDLAGELSVVEACGLPQSDWIVRNLRNGRMEMP